VASLAVTDGSELFTRRTHSLGLICVVERGSLRNSQEVIQDLRVLRMAERQLRASLVDDLRTFQKKDDLSFFTSPISDKVGISVATTCTGLMALIDSNELDKLDPGKNTDQGQGPTLGRSDLSPSETASQKNIKNGAPEKDVLPAGGPSSLTIKKPESPDELFRRIVEESWESSGLRDLNAFTACMVVRTLGFLAAAGELKTALKDLTHKRPKDKPSDKPIKKGPVEESLGESENPSLLDVIIAIAKAVPETFSVPGYPPKATMGYWFVDGVTKAGVEIEPKYWKLIANWAVSEFDKQLRYVVAGNDPLMDPASLAMAACLISRLRRTFHNSAPLSGYVETLPGRVELIYAIEQVFEHQTKSGIWHKYFPLFHFPKSGAADYTFSFEFLEAILVEFSEDGILSREGILERIESAVHWCENNRFAFRKNDEVFTGWNAGGAVETLAAGMPEAWATACVHMFLWQLESAISDWIQKVVLDERFSRTERPSKDKWTDLIDVDIVIPPEEKTTLQEITENQILAHAQKRNEQTLRKEPLKGRRSALLFGPPGTSKTSFARGISGRLGWPLIIVTPSEFLSSGLEQIYVRATEIFNDLMDLSGVVILFDEMDALAQTRVNPALDVTRQLLTTSMLPKLADLYDRARVIFFMATNHQKDLDAAITRPGRFDLLLCVGPPSWKAKLKGLKQALKDLAVGDIDQVRKLLEQYTDASATQEQLDLFTVGDFRSFVENIRRKAQKETLLRALQTINRDQFQKDISEWAKAYITLATTPEKKPHDTELDALAEFNLDKQASRIQ